MNYGGLRHGAGCAPTQPSARRGHRRGLIESAAKSGGLPIAANRGKAVSFRTATLPYGGSQPLGGMLDPRGGESFIDAERRWPHGYRW